MRSEATRKTVPLDDIYKPEGVLPHDGKEAAMLGNGSKQIASFVSPQTVPSDVRALIDRGKCCLIENTVARQGKSRPGRQRKTDVTIAVVFAPEARDRAQTLLELMVSVHCRSLRVTDDIEREIGRLHGYTEEQITIFLQWRKQYQDSLLPSGGSR